jgi:exosortase H (IPTLxxWG-CTERM-specific)
VLRPRHARLNAGYALGLAAVAVFLWLAFRDEVMGPVLEPLRTLIAQATLALIHGVGMEATRHGSAIYHPGGFAYEISRGCTGFVPAVMLAAAISGYPAQRRWKVVGLALGIPALLGINLGRLVHLFYLGVHQPDWFDVAHKVAWEGLIILAVVGFWLGWATWVDRGSEPRRQAQPNDPVLRRPLERPHVVELSDSEAEEVHAEGRARARNEAARPVAEELRPLRGGPRDPRVVEQGRFDR